MKKVCALSLPALCLTAAAALGAQQPPQATELSGNVFVIKHTWFIGGTGPWDYLTLDPVARRLFIAHGAQVQVVDAETGALAGRITGFREAHAIALDASGEFGYISDGTANQVKVFDRRSLQVVAFIPTGPAPRALALDAQTGLLFAICTNPLAETEQQPAAPEKPGPPNPHGPPPNSAPRNPSNREVKTSISVIDVAARRRVAEILMPGRLGFAQSDDNGQVFVLVVNRNQVARLDASSIAAMVQQNPAAFAHLDWSREAGAPSQGSLRLFSLGSGCHDPLSLAVDGAHQRVFAACGNMRLTVLNAGTGDVVASLPIGPGADAVSFDPGRGLIFTANGGAQGTLTVIRQDVTDTYSEIQNLPTRQRARTLAVNTETGEVYLVTDYVGVNLAKPGGIGTLQSTPVAGSFQVLVIGH